MRQGLMAIALLIFAACGKPVTCPMQPTLCGPTEQYGPQCMTFTQYQDAGWDVTAAAETCHLGVIDGCIKGVDGCR